MSGGKSHGRRQITLEDCACSLKPHCLVLKHMIESKGLTFRNCPVSDY